METAFSLDRLSGDELLRRGLSLRLPARKVSGMVYVVRVGRYCKVGITSNINKRMHHFRSSCPLQVTLVLTLKVPDPEALEAAVHRDLEKNHHRGEWFAIGVSKARAAVLRQRDRLWPPPPAHLKAHRATYAKYVGEPVQEPPHE